MSEWYLVPAAPNGINVVPIDEPQFWLPKHADLAREAERRLQEKREAEERKRVALRRANLAMADAARLIREDRKRKLCKLHIEAVERFRARLDATPAMKRAERVVDLSGVEPATNWRTPQDEYLTIMTEVT